MRWRVCCRAGDAPRTKVSKVTCSSSAEAWAWPERQGWQARPRCASAQGWLRWLRVRRMLRPSLLIVRSSSVAASNVLAIGPGMGQDAWAAALFDMALRREMPSVLDADALNLLARTSLSRDCWILTPHPGEAGRLLGTDAAAVQRDRLGSANAIAARYGGTIVLKGAGTLVVTREALPTICDQGNPGMASPGMGDVLTGVIAGITAQTSDLPGAARAGVLVHAMAGDMAARRGERGMLATDLFTYLPTCVNPTQRL